MDPNPTDDETTLIRNSGRGPGATQLNLRVSKTTIFGSTKTTFDVSGQAKEVKPRYGLVFTVEIRNVANHNNPGPIIGNIASSLFGKANQAAGSATQNRHFFFGICQQSADRISDAIHVLGPVRVRESPALETAKREGVPGNRY